MNTPWQAVWLLAVEAAGVVAVTGLIAWRLRSVVWQRTLWQASLLALAGLLLVEFSSLNLFRSPQSAPEVVAAVPNLALSTPAVTPIESSPAVPVIEPSQPIATSSPEPFTMPELAPMPSPKELAPLDIHADAVVAQTELPKDSFPLALALLLGVWAVGALVLASRLLVGRFILLRFCARSQTVFDVALFERVQGIARKLGLKQSVQVLEASRIHTPVVFGLFRLTIALPAGFTERFDWRQQEAILAHELAHLAARDPLWYLLADGLVSVLWWHPLVWLARARLQVTSEMAADEACVLAENGPETLAECLVTIAQEISTPGSLESIGIEGSGFRSRLGQRVERLLNLSAELVQRPSAWRTRLVKLGLPVVLIGILLLGSGWMRRDQATPWSGLLGGAWNMMAGMLQTAEPEPSVKRDPRPILVADGTVQAIPADAQGTQGGASSEVDILLKAAKRHYGRAQYGEAEELLKRALTLGPKTPEAVVFLDFLGEFRQQEEIRRQISLREDAGGALPRQTRTLPIDADALVIGLEKMTGKKPEMREEAVGPISLQDAGRIDVTNTNWGKWRQVITLIKDFAVNEGADTKTLSLEPGFLSSMNRKQLAFLTVHGTKNDLDATKRAVDKLHEMEEQAQVRPTLSGAIAEARKLNDSANKKLDEIVMPELFMDGLPLGEAVKFLTEESKRLDPEKEGLKFEMLGVVPGQFEVKPGAPLDPLGNPILSPVSGAKKSLEDVIVLVNPVKKGLKFRQVMEAICEEADVPLQFSVQNGVIIISAKPRTNKKAAVSDEEVRKISTQKNETAILVQEGKRLYEAKKFEEAETKLKEAVTRDPANQAAYYYLNLVQTARYGDSTGKRDAVQRTRIVDVERKWEIPMRSGTSMAVSTNYAGKTTRGRELILQKLDRIIVKELKFDGVPLSAVALFLREESEKQDLEKKGINFIINSNLDEQPIAGVLTNRTAVDLEKMTVKINPALRNLTMAQALEAIVQVASGIEPHALTFAVEDYAVVFRQRIVDPPQMFVRRYQIDSEAFLKTLTEFSRSNGDLDTNSITGSQNGVSRQIKTEQIQAMVRQFFAKEGVIQSSNVTASAQTQIFYNDRTGILLVRAPLSDLDIVQRALEKIQAQPKATGTNGAVSWEVQSLPVPKKEGGEQSPAKDEKQRTSVGKSPADNSQEERITKVFKVDADSISNGFRQMMKASGLATENTTTNLQDMMREFIRKAGVNVGANHTNGPVLFLNDKTGVVLVRATPKEMEIIVQALDIVNLTSPQINIESRYIEVSDKTAMELGLNWFTSGLLAGTNITRTGAFLNPSIPTNHNVRVESPTLPNHVSILSPSQSKALIKQFSNRDGVEVMTAPRVTTVHNRWAKIEVGETMTAVVERQVKPAVNDKGEPENHTLFLTSQVATGTTVQLLPKILPDGVTINLDWVVCFTEFLGYDKPPKGVDTSEPLPRFGIRQVANINTLRDGQTLLAGCGTTEKISYERVRKGGVYIKEKRVTKKHVIILVTPRIIDPAGNPLNRDEELGY